MHISRLLLCPCFWSASGAEIPKVCMLTHYTWHIMLSVQCIKCTGVPVWLLAPHVGYDLVVAALIIQGSLYDYLLFFPFPSGTACPRTACGTQVAIPSYGYERARSAVLCCSSHCHLQRCPYWLHVRHLPPGVHACKLPSSTCACELKPSVQVYVVHMGCWHGQAHLTWTTYVEA